MLKIFAMKLRDTGVSTTISGEAFLFSYTTNRRAICDLLVTLLFTSENFYT
jgi:hypothetical protein